MALVADYETVRLLGTGSHGQVWLAVTPDRLPVDVSEVALKMFDRRPVSRRELGAVADEMRQVAAVANEHLARQYDVGLAGDRLYLSREYAAGGTLAEPSRPLDPAEKALAVAAAARGAHALHEAGIAHREIKPSNILLADSGAKLADPGIAHVLAPGQTVTGVAPKATVEFLEPGVARGERAVRASDVWSLGVTLHWLLTGASVYGKIPEGNLVTVLTHVIGTPPKVSSDIREERAAIIRACLAPDRAERYPTALAVAEAIEQTEQLVSA